LKTLELLMDLILGSCWIWVKFLLDKALQCWVEELCGGELQEEKYGLLSLGVVGFGEM